MPSSTQPSDPKLADLRDQWAARWPHALAHWSRFTKLSEPRWCLSQADEKREGIAGVGSFAMIRLLDHAVVISLNQVRGLGLDAFADEILAHEIGHHVYTPGDLSDNARLLARIRRGLPTQEKHAAMISNLYEDLLINDRLQRDAGLHLDRVYAALETPDSGEPSRLWTLYMRIYESLWSLPKSTLAKGKIDAALNVDANLGARLIRSYAKDWLRGGGRFAMLCLPYLIEDEQNAKVEFARRLKQWHDTQSAGAGGIPEGLVEIDEDELEAAIHPAEDPELSGIAASQEDKEGAQSTLKKASGSTGQCREPFEYGEILRAAGVNLSAEEIAIRYYRERARPHLVRFPTKENPTSTDPLPEGFEIWELGSSLESIDWLQSAIGSPRVFPGLTTVQRTWGESPGREPEREPIDLDIYIDSSGSMPDPQHETSFLALAGTIIALSALRVGGRVQATLWSGTNQWRKTDDFSRDESEILGIITGVINGATAFPIHVLRDTFQDRKASERAVHILVISDDGVTTMFDSDEKGNSGWDISQMALRQARGGATMALNLYSQIEASADLIKAREQGWRVHRVSDWGELLAFARAFSREQYGQKPTAQSGNVAGVAASGNGGSKETK